ncbi:hypothetical protein [Ureibacillus acetophenoni]
MKIDIDEFLHKNPFTLERIPWVETGFFYTHNDGPVKAPLSRIRVVLYSRTYIAMAVGEFVNPKTEANSIDLVRHQAEKLHTSLVK